MIGQHKEFTSIHQSSLMKVVIETDVAKCQHHFGEYKIKMWWLNPGRRMIQEAKQLGMKTMVRLALTESTVGISAITYYRNWIT
jgi:hypothetical protein